MASPKHISIAILILQSIATSVVGASDISTKKSASKADVLEPAKAAIRIKRYAEAITLLKQQATAGNASAQYLLGALYLSGLEGNGSAASSNESRARQWLEPAANQDARAALTMSWLEASSTQSGVNADNFNADSINKDKAQQWLQRAADLGSEQARSLIKTHSLPLQQRPPMPAEMEIKRDLFWWAAAHNDVTTLSELESDASNLITRSDEFGRTALHLAAQAGAAASMQWLLAHHAQSSADHFGVTPLMLAATAPHAVALPTLLQQQSVLSATDQLGNTALMYAARCACESNVEALLAAGADIQARNQSDWSALEFAQQSGATRIATLLQSKGLVSHRSIGKTSAVLFTDNIVLHPSGKTADLYSGWNDIAVWVTRDSSLTGNQFATLNAQDFRDDSLLMIAVNNNATKSTITLLEKGANANQADSQGHTPLVVATQRGYYEALRALLAGGASANTHGDHEDAPLIAAIRAEQQDAVRELLRAHATPDVVDQQGSSALIIATQRNQRETVNLLIEYGVNVDAIDRNQRSALWYAVQSSASGSTIVQDLIKAHASLDLPDRNSVTPFLNAAALGQTTHLETLLAANANARSKNSLNESALLLASANGRQDAVARLLKTQPDVNAQSSNGDTALIAAARNGHNKIVELLLNAGASTKLRNSDKASALDVARNLGFTFIAARLETH